MIYSKPAPALEDPGSSNASERTNFPGGSSIEGGLLIRLFGKKFQKFIFTFFITIFTKNDLVNT